MKIFSIKINVKQNEKIENKIVETYAEDMAKVIEDSQGGIIKKIIHGEEEQEIQKRNLSPQSRKNKLFMFISLLLILVASTIFSFFFLNKSTNTVPVEEQFVPLVFNDKSAFIEVKDFSKDQIVESVLNEVKGTLVKSGGVEGIYLSYDKKIVGWREFITLIKGSFALDNNDGTPLVNNNFLMGVVRENNQNDTRDFFILLKVLSTADIFSSFRAWENKMFLDLHGFFGIDISPETNYLLTKNFEDGIVENKNARILYDTDSKIIMMYIFADDTSVIITNTKNAAHEIMLRLASSQIKK